MSPVARSRSAMCRGTVSPAVVLVLPFDRALLWAIICFLGPLMLRDKLFEEGLGWKGERPRV